MYHTSHYSSHNPGEHGRLLISPLYSNPVYEVFHEDKTGGCSGNGYEKADISCDDVDGRQNRSSDDGDLRYYMRVDDGRRGSISKDTRKISSRNMGETICGNGRGGHRPHTIHSSSHNPGDHGRLLCIPGSSIHVDDIIHEN